MKITPLKIADVLLLEPKTFTDARGFFFESFNARSFEEATGLRAQFVQDNHSKSTRGVLRGLHFQLAPHQQAKLVRVISGEVLDVALDIRPSSATFGQAVKAILSAENKRHLWIPEGFAHGFVVLSETAELLYKTTEYYEPKFERCILWNDPALLIDWHIENPLLSAKDACAPLLKEVFP